MAELFRGNFRRTAEVIPSKDALRKTSYEVVTLDRNGLPDADKTVRAVEDDFAAIYDTVQFQSPGMRYMALQDTRTLRRWMGDVNGKRILDIGPGTGRATLPMAEAIGNGKVFAVDTAAGYLEVLAKKAAIGGVKPENLKLGIGDIQRVTLSDLQNFTEGGNLDAVTLWFGPLALMATDPQGVINTAAQLLKPGGELMLSTNSLNGVAYRIPEQYIQNGADTKLPLGYQPSIFTRRSFPEGDMRQRPNGMILGNGSILPATFYSPDEIKQMLSTAGLTSKSFRDTVGTSFLTGLFPVQGSEDNAYARFKDIAKETLMSAGYQNSADSLDTVPVDPKKLWTFAAKFDEIASFDDAIVARATYPAIRAVKPK